MSEADGASPSSEETSFTPVVDEPSTNPQAAKAKQNGKKVRNTKRSAKPQAAEANTEAKEVPATAVVPEDTVPAEAEATPEAAAPVKEAPAPAKGKAQGSAECAGQGLPATVEQTAAAPEDEQKEVAAAGPKEMEQPREDVSTSAEGDKGKAEVEAGDLNKVAAAGPDETEHPREDGDKCKEEDSLVEAAGRGDLEKVKEFLANSSDPNELENGKETSSFAPEPAAFRRLAQEKGLLAPPDGKLPGTTALIAAVVSGHSHVAWELLRSRADLDARDSDGLTALSAASCSTACDIHMWFLLHRAASQTQKSINQSSSSEADIQESDFRKRFVNNFCRRFLWDRNHQEEETRILRMLVTLLLGQGQDCTEMVRGLLKKVDIAKPRWESLKEPVGTVLCDYAWDRKQVQRFLEESSDDQMKAEEVDAFALRWHSFFGFREVEVVLHRIPLAAPLACTSSVLQAVAVTQNEETLQTNAAEVITEAAWLQFRFTIVVDILLNCVGLGCLCLVTWKCRYGGMDAQPELWVLSAILCKEFVECIWHCELACVSFLRWLQTRDKRVCMERVRQDVDYRINGKDIELLNDEHVFLGRPVFALDNMFDVFFLFAGFNAIWRQTGLCSKQELEPFWLPAFCSMYWLRLMYSLRGERWLGPYLLPIISAVRDTGAFLFVTSLCVASATHAYVIMNPRGDDEYPIYSSFLHTVRLAIFGDFDLFEYQGQDTTFEQVDGEWAPNDPSPKDVGELPYIYLQLCFFVTGIGITVLLMNLLIAILGQNYEIHQGRAQVLFMQARARMLLEVQWRPWMLMSSWLGRHLWDRRAPEPPHPNWLLATLPEIALSPLKEIMAPPPARQRASYQRNIFERFRQQVLRALWSLDRKYPICRVAMPVVCLVLLAGSLISWLIFVAIAINFVVLFPSVIPGLRYTINRSFFGLYGDCFAEECEIFALVRTDTGLDDMRSMRSDLKDKIQSLHQEQKDRMRILEAKLEAKIDNMDGKIDRLLQVVSKVPA